MTSTTPMTPATDDFDDIDEVPRRVDSVIPQVYFNSVQRQIQQPFKLTSPGLCSGIGPLVVMMVMTLPNHVDRRMAIRDTWGAAYNLPHHAMPLVFLLGDTTDLNAQTDIASENSIYGDIVQGRFMDSESNLTMKTVMAFTWARRFCSTADYVLIATDTAIIDTFKLVPYLLLQKPMTSGQFILCDLVPCCPTVKGQTPPNEAGQRYLGSEYPAHCSGLAYVLPSSVIKKMHAAALRTPLFTPTDVYVGVLAEKLGVGFQDTSKSFGGLLDQNASLEGMLNHSSYLDSPLMVGDLTQQGKSTSRTLRKLWLLIVEQHRTGPRVNAQRFMQIPQETDRHVHSVATLALVVDLVILAAIAYFIFRRRRHHKATTSR